ncbi:helix-turn-helix transcriptional regulator [Burkholderia sp. Ac-20365]|uniref:helix-turn-helix domain-containing protein n=1 Tax=Burkholderia sp. Ac-20365 TaxID=2703897 RepID=UPI00197C5101|nr:helix-turn-helix transcriptional regulator [Burkholderia sp. Ac-20365]MBN3761215.1 helix-turn-helix transcriptional regulator [Burkholderia sp. Ac-20365]
MSEIDEICKFIKDVMKTRRITYRRAAELLGISEVSVKRLFSQRRLSAERLSDFARILDMTLVELVTLAATPKKAVAALSEEQESRLVADETLLLVTVCAMNHWTVDEIVGVYNITRAQCIKHLLTLERMEIADLLPGDRIRLRVSRDFGWLPGGPFQRFFVTQELGDFLASHFAGEDETLEFVHGMLTQSAIAELQVELRRVRQRVGALHAESIGAPLSDKRGTGIVIAMREWEPESFTARRLADKKTPERARRGREVGHPRSKKTETG